MTTDPTTITRSQLLAALEALGISDHHHVKRVDIRTEAVRIVRYRLDETGGRFAAGNQAATVTTVAAVDWDDEEATR